MGVAVQIRVARPQIEVRSSVAGRGPTGGRRRQRGDPIDDPIEELTAKFLRACEEAGEGEQRVAESLSRRLHISHDTNREFEGSLTVGQRLADRIAIFGGSWTFILLFLSVVFTWVVLNTVVLARVAGPFDPYPYIFLNLILSMLAALQAPVIMMSQNRNASKDRVAAAHDYEVNLKAELEILALHRKIDRLRQEQWTDLLAMQREQILLLTELLGGRGVPTSRGLSPDATPHGTRVAAENEEPGT